MMVSSYLIPDSLAEILDALLTLLGHPPQIQHCKSKALFLGRQRGTQSCLAGNKVASQLSNENQKQSLIYNHAAF